jgi:hypothetical protein
MPKKLGRNALCWCGSGRKYKRCHLDRENQSRVNPFETEQEQIKLFTKKYCIFTDKSKCEGQIVRAHTIQRNGSLDKIAKGGHVYQLKPSMTDLIKTGGKVVPKLIGVRKATTFTGFCNFHDTEIFKPLESVPFIGNDEQCFLLAFRAIARELYTKRAAIESISLLKETDKGKDIQSQRLIQEFILTYKQGTERGLATLESHFNEYVEKYVAQDFGGIRFLVIYMNNVPEIMFSGGFYPEFNFRGQLLQDLSDLTKKTDLLTQSSFATDDGGAIVYSWLSSSDGTCRNFAESLLELRVNNLPNAIVRLCFEHSENTAISPEWWSSLKAEKQEVLINRFTYSGSPLLERRSDCLADDGLNYVEWNIRDIKAKLT